ncbi:single-stranded DNA-binding protein [Nocardiopsis sp. MG754419]|uniref:single-stranded DNA-binding protein n=1 Tax=Nocardiopsis sp. MG754419 TaxID=2259865 RepID=UPI0027DB6F14|nr:single-stranded DNA-binding protein [Nocardiopsis sp. MG754419]
MPTTASHAEPAPTAGAEPAEATARPGTNGSTVDREPDRDRGHLNQVLVIGRITAAPTLRELPSGDRLVTWRIGVARPTDPRRRGARMDSLTLFSFDEAIIEWIGDRRVGEVLRVTGALRRRIWPGRHGVRSVLEVEVVTVAPVPEAER